ncbi:type II secretion system protein [uncultured Campylobacter sp.]|uniref:type II secretion system protein n=1 Tax=uncultured Campylobacter sp. TaxID=218934 RepID=UPI00260BA775|nr:prepilin-type N-terminal cleavage/methylation domain-containing protein [uncultured Campylobacter sp.]
MKKGFTMIELIFVIVILGILAAVAIPRLAATRDDAEVSKAATNVQTLITDLGSYYTSQGNFSDKIEKMSNVANPVKVKKEVCLTVDDTKIDNVNGTIGATVSTSGLCGNVWGLPGLSQIKANISQNGGKFKFGGMGVVY